MFWLWLIQFNLILNQKIKVGLNGLLPFNCWPNHDNFYIIRCVLRRSFQLGICFINVIKNKLYYNYCFFLRFQYFLSQIYGMFGPWEIVLERQIFGFLWIFIAIMSKDNCPSPTFPILGKIKQKMLQGRNIYEIFEEKKWKRTKMRNCCPRRWHSMN